MKTPTGASSHEFTWGPSDFGGVAPLTSSTLNLCFVWISPHISRNVYRLPGGGITPLQFHVLSPSSTNSGLRYQNNLLRVLAGQSRVGFRTVWSIGYSRASVGAAGVPEMSLQVERHICTFIFLSIQWVTLKSHTHTWTHAHTTCPCFSNAIWMLKESCLNF